MNVNIDLTDEQVKFLKQFAANQHEGANDNLGTCKPLHLVQTEMLEYMHDGGGNGDYDIYVKTDSLDGKEFTSERDLVLEYGNYEKAEDVVNYDTAYYGDEINGKTICSLEDYFKAYGICSPVECCSVVKKYRTVAYFFILENAKEYLKYQSHNLTNPRTYTVSCGYANKGEYEPFFDLLMTLGTQLNKQTT